MLLISYFFIFLSFFIIIFIFILLGKIIKWLGGKESRGCG